MAVLTKVRHNLFSDESASTDDNEATGLSQQKFGTALGVSKATIENIELGRAPVSEALAEAIGALTGGCSMDNFER